MAGTGLPPVTPRTLGQRDFGGAFQAPAGAELLAADHVGVPAALGHKVVVRAGCGDLAFAEHDDPICAADGGQAVGDDEGGAAEGQAVEGFLNQASVSASTDEVASSRMRIGASLRMARAMEMRCC